jgi:hypothetical protein
MMKPIEGASDLATERLISASVCSRAILELCCTRSASRRSLFLHEIDRRRHLAVYASVEGVVWRSWNVLRRWNEQLGRVMCWKKTCRVP